MSDTILSCICSESLRAYLGVTITASYDMGLIIRVDVYTSRAGALLAFIYRSITPPPLLSPCGNCKPYQMVHGISMQFVQNYF